MAPPRRSGGSSRGRTRRKVRKNVAVGQAHIKTSFNNTIVALTDREGNVLTARTRQITFSVAAEDRDTVVILSELTR